MNEPSLNSARDVARKKAQDDKAQKEIEMYQRKMAAGASALEEQTPLLRQQLEMLEAQLGTLTANNEQLEAMCQSLSQSVLEAEKDSARSRIISYISLAIAFLSLLAQILPFVL